MGRGQLTILLSSNNSIARRETKLRLVPLFPTLGPSSEAQLKEVGAGSGTAFSLPCTATKLRSERWKTRPGTADEMTFKSGDRSWNDRTAPFMPQPCSVLRACLRIRNPCRSRGHEAQIPSGNRGFDEQVSLV